MIQVDKIRQVYIIGPEETKEKVRDKAVRSLLELGKYTTTSVKFNWIPTDHIEINEGNTHQQLEALYPILNKLDVALGGPKVGKGSEQAQEVNPKTVLFVVDSQDKAGAALARLLEKQWGGYPFASQTIVV